MSKAIRVRYGESVLKPLEPLELRKGGGENLLLIPVGEEKKKTLGKISEEEIEELLLEAGSERL